MIQRIEPLTASSRPLLFLGFLILFALAFARPLYSAEVTAVEVKGNTVDVGLDSLLRGIRGKLSNVEIKSIGVKVTDAYHEKGYTTSYVEKLVLREDGVLEVLVRESRVLGLRISGLDGKEAAEIEAAVLPAKNEIYNRFVMRDRFERIKGRYNLESVKVYPVNYEETGDVFLSVEVRKRKGGTFYGGIGIEPIYGITPEAGYYYPSGSSLFVASAEAGYREGVFRKAAGDIRVYFFSDKGNTALYFGAQGGRYVERWESRALDYTSLSAAPLMGVRYLRPYLQADLTLKEICTRLGDYAETSFMDYDTRLTLEADISDRETVLERRESTDLKISLSAGRNRLEKKGYFIGSIDFRTSLSLSSRLNLIPRAGAFGTSSDERFFRSYVFNRDLLGFFRDFTASRWKNTAGLDMEFEVSPNFVYLGPFVNGGLFRDEYDQWMAKAGTGMKGRIVYKKIDAQFYYAWDITRAPSKGGLYIIAGSRF